MAYMDEMALEREKSKQALLAGKQPLLGDDATAAMHALGVNLGIVPRGTPPSAITQLLESFVRNGPKGVKVDDPKQLQVSPVALNRTPSTDVNRYSDGGPDLGATLKGLFDAAKGVGKHPQQKTGAAPAPPATGASLRDMARRGRSLHDQTPTPAPAVNPQDVIPGLRPGSEGARVSPSLAAAESYMTQREVPKSSTIGGAGGDMKLAAGRSFEGVNPQFAQAAQEYARIYHGQNGQYDVTLTSGKRGGDAREHGKGNAFDMQLVDKQTGKPLENYQTNDPKTFKAYQDYANGFHQFLEQKYPDLAAKHRWGGYFSGGKETYGSNDVMHHDLAGDRVGIAGGSWKDGLSPSQLKHYPGLEAGGGLSTRQPPGPQQPYETPFGTKTTLPGVTGVERPAQAASAAGANGATSLHAGEYPTPDQLRNTSVAAGDRFNNPFNMWHDGYANVHGGQPGIKITEHDTPAVYANKEAGAAAAIQKMAQSPLYSGKTMQDMIGQWVGHGESYAPIIEKQTGIPRNTPITPQFLASPDGMKFLKAMSRYETDSSKPYPLTDAQWEKARNVALNNPPALGNSIDSRPAGASVKVAGPATAAPGAAAPAAQPPSWLNKDTATALPAETVPPAAAPDAVTPPAAAPDAAAPAAAATPPNQLPPVIVDSPAPAAAAAPPQAKPVAAAAPVPAAPKPQQTGLDRARALVDQPMSKIVTDPAERAQIPAFALEKTPRQLSQMPVVGGQFMSKAEPLFQKHGFTRDDATKALAEPPAAPGKRSDLGTSGATDFSSRGRTPMAPPGLDKVPLPQPGPRTENRNAAQVELNMTPQERDLYQRHLDNLYGKGGVDNPPTAENPEGSRSSLFQSVDKHDGRYYNLPNVYDGKKVDEAESLKRAGEQGWDKFPSYKTPEEAEARYQQMHDYMDKDTGRYFDQNPRPQAPQQPQVTPEMAKALENAFKDEARVPQGPPPPPEALPVQPINNLPQGVPGGPQGGLPMAPGGLSSLPSNAYMPATAGSQGGSIATAGLMPLPAIEQSTYSTPLLNTMATNNSMFGSSSLSPISPTILGGWGWGGGGSGFGGGGGFDFGGGGGGFDFGGGGMTMPSMSTFGG